MVRARFPGKPSKHFQRRKVSGVNSEDTEGILAAEDVYKRLAVFNMLFSLEDEDNSFHGFSPHENGKRTTENISEENSKRNSSKRKIGSASSYRKIRTETAEIPDELSYSDSDNSSCISPEPSPILGISDASVCQPDRQIVKSPLRDEKKDVPNASGLPGVFIFPTRSAHSSRVIKPNKRFLQSDTSLIPIKRPRMMNKSESSEHNSSLTSEHSNSSVKKVSYYKCVKSPRKTEMSSTSPVKFILRKPRLKIKTQPLSTVGGPFSSPSGSSFRGLKYSYSRLMKVCCGVCGYMCTYKFFRQARKFGIFSCESCRRFILKMIKLEREKQLEPLVCCSGTGNCAIRQSTLVSQPFSEEISCKNGEDDLNRCEGCWLNLCLRSFQMPQSLCHRLTTYLPVQINQKSIVNPDSCSVSSWSDVKSITDNETRIFRRGRGATENIALRRGSNTSLRLSSHRSRALREEEGKRQRGRQRLPLSGPRVKHVCRSASLVLGQPSATFLSSSTQSKSGTNQQQIIEVQEICEHVESSNTEVESVTSQGSDRLKKQEVVEVESQEKNEPLSRPVARMLQDLGRANCELLDGMENHELEKQNAKVSIDFWESYDPEEVTQTGFPLIGFSPLTIKAVCFLCGSSGLEKMVHCASCCEPYHTFCVSNLRTGTEALPGMDWWRVDWLCPKCTQCEVCGRTGGSQVSCTKCHKAFHSSCITTPRSSASDSNWVCPSCLFCKSCNGTAVHVFVGNIPLCKTCFKLRKKGSFCPLCQRCYDDNDYSTNMMECAECNCWIHANCEGISNEKYQVLSYLPSHVEFVCKLCCKSPPAPWFLAVNAELKAGYLNVIKCLSKNKNACALLKASPKKQRVCVCLDNHRNPIHLPNLCGNSDTDSGNDSSSRTSPDRDFKCPDLGLLTPKLTKDDEESLKTVKRDFLNLVSDKDETCSPNSKVTLGEKSVKIISSKDDSQLLKIAFDKMEGSDVSTRESSIDLLSGMEEKMVSAPSEKKMCTCQNSENSSLPLNLMSVKNKASMDEYKSVSEFHKDMDLVILDIGTSDLVEAYHKSVKQVFPWFDPNDSRVCDSSMTDIDLENKIPTSPLTSEKKTVNKENDYAALKGLLNLDQDAYYIGVKASDSRHCMLCKSVGEGLPNREGRLLYCGQNEWVHTNCALWSSEVFEEIDGSLQNVYSAISRARLIRCYECGKKGASLGCCARSCPFAYHFSCALSAECSFLENKEVYCKAHSNLRAVKEINKDQDFPITRSVYVELEHKKKKNVRRNEVRLFIGSLSVSHIGDILPELSDNTEIIIPCDYLCSRLYWSCKEPWKIVRYSIQTKVTNLTNECCYDTDTNYTVDHSLEFTPPPSPVETFSKPSFSEKDIRAVLSHLVDSVCSKEEEGNLSDQQSTDLFPPEIQDAIFKDLPQDFLDRVSVHDIFTKMSFDNILLSEAKSEKTDPSIESYTGAPITKLNDYDNEKTFGKKVVNTQVKKSQNNILKVMSVVKQKGLEKIKDHENYLDGGKSNHWKRQSLLQVDGAADLSESDLSNDSCDLAVGFSEQSNEDTPVKCSRCHRTYRTSNSYEKHIPTCNADYMSCSESDLSEEEKTQQGTPESENVIRPITTNGIQQIMMAEPCATVESAQIIDASSGYTLAIDSNLGSIGKVNSTLVEAPFDNSLICVNSSEAYRDFSSTSERVINISYPSGSGPPLHTSYSNEQTLVASVESVSDQSRVMNLQAPTQAIILHQVPGDNMLSTYLPPYQEAPQPSVQYISAINQEKTQYLTTASLGPQFQIQPQPMIQNVPTVLGTIIQPNGMEQLVLNNSGSLNNMDVYGQQQNNLYIANTPMIVGMETVVSNTVMSSSRFISGSAPGMLSASSYSATTTQVFQAAKPVIDIPQGYVVVSSNPPVVENGNCVQNIIQNGSLTQPSWNNYKINYQDAIKLNKNITYQTLTQQIVSQKQEINGIKLVDPREQGMQIISASIPPKPCRTIAPQEIENQTNNCSSFSNSCNIIELHQPHHNPPVQYVKPSHLKVEVPPPAVYREKLHPAVAPIHKRKSVPAPPLAPAPVPVPQPPPSIKQLPLLEPPSQGIVKCNGQTSNDTQNIKTEEKLLENMQIRNEEILEVGEDSSVQDIIETQPVDSFVLLESQPFKETTEKPVLDSTDDKTSNNNIVQVHDIVQTNKVKTNGCDSLKKRKILHEEPKITYEITSEDGFSFSTTNIQEAWMKVFETVQQARRTKNLPPLSQNPFSSPDSMLKKLMGLGNNSVKYLLEQLPGISGCSKYKPAYHKKTLSVLEQELSKGGRINPTGCARTEPFRHSRKTYDMFSWLASRHRRPPKLLTQDNDGLNGNSRRATSMNLPMAMRFRHLKETSKVSVGVFRSDIHGRGLFCLRDIDSGEMVIEYAGEVIRSALTDKRERYYTEKGIGCYMFRIDDKFVVDATMKGNAARFINHSCEPNCYSRVIDILGKKHILIFALRRILQGEELTYDYKFPLEEEKINCHCLSRKCRKYLN